MNLTLGGAFIARINLTIFVAHMICKATSAIRIYQNEKDHCIYVFVVSDLLLFTVRPISISI